MPPLMFHDVSTSAACFVVLTPCENAKCGALLGADKPCTKRRTLQLPNRRTLMNMSADSKEFLLCGFNVQSRLLQVLADPCWPLSSLQKDHMFFNDTYMAQKRLQSKKSDAAGMFFWNQLQQRGNKDLDGYSICTYRA